MTKAEKLAHINTLLPPCLQVLNTKVLDFDNEALTCELAFDVSEQFCHSVNVVQGGNVTVMLDAAMSHAAFVTADDIAGLPSLEIKVSFLEPTLAGPVKARGRVVKMGRSTAFLEGTLINGEGKVSARSTATAKVVRRERGVYAA
ncbi:hotdog fold thioesterase [Parahaliea mediterranea]|uniref:PaaI family thioesterase n=1 Tax=Parahaliea mediterranea TaxID=651086 RepID=A0A939DD25_9GAMM|nr:PaaI family thioesterase [Parahaliea mediterranea]